MRENTTCKTCSSLMDKYQGYYGHWYECSNMCVKCKGCYGYCECSKKRWEYKECKYCNNHILTSSLVSTCKSCCRNCKSECKYICNTCGNKCDDNCSCVMDCYFCDNKISRTDFIYDDECSIYVGKTHQFPGIKSAMCDECANRQCQDNMGPCMTPCKVCKSACDSDCGCICPLCNMETESGGCKCYDAEYVNFKLQENKDKRDMTKRFKDGQYIRHKVSSNIWVGIYNLNKNTILFKNNEYSTLSGFALAHYKSMSSQRKSVNGWKECEYEDEGVWKSTY